MARAARLSGADPDDEDYEEFEEMLEQAQTAQVSGDSVLSSQCSSLPLECPIPPKSL
jgi:hypothetical protein